MSLEPRVRDIYGLPCCSDYEELLQTYTPIWIELDDCQTHHWERFLAVAAQQLGIREQRGLDDPGVDLSLESPDSHQVIVSVLQQLLARGERHAPEVSLDSKLVGWLGEVVISLSRIATYHESIAKYAASQIVMWQIWQISSCVRLTQLYIPYLCWSFLCTTPTASHSIHLVLP